MRIARLYEEFISSAEGIPFIAITPFVGYSRTPAKDPLAFHF